MRYADDTALIATVQKDIQKIVNTIKEESSWARHGCQKTKTMIISRNPEGKKKKLGWTIKH